MGNASRLDDGPPVAFVGRRQEHLDCEAATLLDFAPSADGEEAGLTVWMNPTHHFTGVYFALYATGNGSASEAAAFFDWCDYRVLQSQA